MSFLGDGGMFYRLEARVFHYGDMGDRGESIVDDNVIFSSERKAMDYAEFKIRKNEGTPELSFTWKDHELVSTGWYRAKIVKVEVDPQPR